MKKYYLVRFSKKTGKIDVTMGGYSSAMMKSWALQNTTKTKDCLIFDEEGTVIYHTIGTDSFPKVFDEKNEFSHIDDYAEGLLEVMSKEFAKL